MTTKETFEHCGRNVAIGANTKQCCCPICHSKDIYLDAMVSQDYDFGMNCNKCGHTWDGDELGECICNGDFIKHYQEKMCAEKGASPTEKKE